MLEWWLTEKIWVDYYQLLHYYVSVCSSCPCFIREIISNMVQILYWKELASKLKITLQEKVKTYFAGKSVYMAILFLWDNISSKVYVEKKIQYGNDIWIDVKLVNNLSTYEEIITSIDWLNSDENCVWIIIQLPLPENLQKYKSQILSRVQAKKDIDWLGGVLLGLSSIDLIDFLPATPKSVFYLLDSYGLGNIVWKKICVLWQSNLAGKPIVLEAIKRGALVTSLNAFSDIENTRKITKESDYIISCTWQVNLVDDTFLRDDKSQIIIDVWYGHVNWKPVGDVNMESIHDKVLSYTPVPGWVGPLTVACLFDNIFCLSDLDLL